MKHAAPRHAPRRRSPGGKGRRFRQPSSKLMMGALAGLLGFTAVASGCEDGPIGPAPATAGSAGGSGTPDGFYDIVVSSTPITYEEFVAACDERGGLVQTTTACAGNNSCKGFSYLEPTLTEHSCKGLNQCGPGYSCVVLPPDSGLTGQEIYEGVDACAAFCHAQFEPMFDPSVYTLHLRPDTLSEEEALNRFMNGPIRRLHSIIGFGVHGVNDSGNAYAHMPPHYQKYSRAEIERVAEYIRTLNIQVSIYGGGH
jgi:hypothetical protein